MYNYFSSSTKGKGGIVQVSFFSALCLLIPYSLDNLKKKKVQKSSRGGFGSKGGLTLSTMLQNTFKKNQEKLGHYTG